MVDITITHAYLVACEVSYAEAYSSDGPEAGDDAENADDNNALLVVPGILTPLWWLIIVLILG